MLGQSDRGRGLNVTFFGIWFLGHVYELFRNLFFKLFLLLDLISSLFVVLSTKYIGIFL